MSTDLFSAAVFVIVLAVASLSTTLANRHPSIRACPGVSDSLALDVRVWGAVVSAVCALVVGGVWPAGALIAAAVSAGAGASVVSTEATRRASMARMPQGAAPPPLACPACGGYLQIERSNPGTVTVCMRCGVGLTVQSDASMGLLSADEVAALDDETRNYVRAAQETVRTGAVPPSSADGDRWKRP